MSSAADPTAAFLASLRASNLLAPAQVDELAAWAARAKPDGPALAREVNRRGWLTPYQIREIFHGRGAGLTLGQFVLLDLLGEGGMGRVFKALQTRLGREVALKIIRTEKLKHPTAAARFEQEVLALGQMRHHPNVVTAYDAGHDGDTHFVVMEFIDGTDLTKLVRDRGPLPIPAACEYIRQAALGLHHAHEMGMVHRDIKPSNLLVTRDGRQVKLVDLGLARLGEAAPTEGGNRVTQEGFVIGTPDFLAPEQARNPMAVDIRADIYALGATLFYILTAKVPFEGANPTEKLLKHVTEPPPELRKFRPEAPPQLEQILRWCMAKRPEDRPQTPMQLALALQPLCPPVPGGPAPAQPAPIPLAIPVAPLPAVPVAAVAATPDPVPSSQAFKLPAEVREQADPIRRRAAPRFPVALVFIPLAGLFVVAVLGYAAYRTLLGGGQKPIEPFTNSVGMKMVLIEGGTFRMGSAANEPGRPPTRPGTPDDEGPVRDVAIRGPFLMAATEVTHTQFLKVMGSAPSRSANRSANAADLPVENVTYDGAVEFCKRLTELEREQPYARRGWAYRLPTEAEWEYCCRAGTTTPFWFGDAFINHRQGLYKPTGEGNEVALEGGSNPDDPPPLPGKVGQFPPNPWGLYDMHGNVAEWCLDWFRRGYPDGPADNPTGPPDGDRRVVRGGSFRDPASACRSASRTGMRPGEKKDSVGFRVVYAPVIK